MMTWRAESEGLIERTLPHLQASEGLTERVFSQVKIRRVPHVLASEAEFSLLESTVLASEAKFL